MRVSVGDMDPEKYLGIMGSAFSLVPDTFFMGKDRKNLSPLFIVLSQHSGTRTAVSLELLTIFQNNRRRNRSLLINGAGKLHFYGPQRLML